MLNETATAIFSLSKMLKCYKTQLLTNQN